MKNFSEVVFFVQFGLIIKKKLEKNCIIEFDLEVSINNAFIVHLN